MTTRSVHVLVTVAFMTTAATAQQPANSSPPDPAIDALLNRFSDDPDRFTQEDGAALYRATCQACHMEDGRGAQGAGAYPPLNDNPKMMSKHFLAGVILTGYHGMPRFGHQMSDDQVAVVTNYIRSHLGNTYTDAITPGEVAALRPPKDMD